MKKCLPFLCLSLIVLIVKLVGQNHSQYLSPQLGYIPFPRSLIGYQIWKEGESPLIRIEVEVVHQKSMIRKVKLVIDAPVAKEMKISNDPEFKQASWVAVRDSFPWLLDFSDTKKIHTVYAVFRYYDEKSKRYRISPIVHDSIKIDQIYKKITRTRFGYFDWHDLAMSIHVFKQKKSSQLDTDFVSLQKDGEMTIAQMSYEMIQSIPIKKDYFIKDFLSLNQQDIPYVRDLISKMNLYRSYYPSLSSIFLEKIFFLGNDHLLKIKKNNKEKLDLYSYLLQKLFNAPYSSTVENFSDRQVPVVVIDTRGSGMLPSLFIDVMDDQKNMVLSPSLNSSQHSSTGFSPSPYVRFVRTLQTMEFPQDTLMVKATSVDSSGVINIQKFYGDLIRNSEKQLIAIANGNFYVIVD